MRNTSIRNTAVLAWLWLTNIDLSHHSACARAVPTSVDDTPTVHPLTSTFETSLLEAYPGSPPNTSTSTITLPHDPRAVPPEYNPADYFEYHAFPNPNTQNMVSQALLGAQIMLYTALQTIGAGPPTPNPPATNPSFLRYFNPGDVLTVGSILQGLLAVLGAPDTGVIRDCLAVPKLQIWYLAHPAAPQRCEEIPDWAYVGWCKDQYGNARTCMVICESFFAEYKRFDEVKCEELGPSIDEGFEEDLPIESAALTIVHELMHWEQVTQQLAGLKIVDVKHTRPDTHVVTGAYRAYYAMKTKDSAWKPTGGLLQNADNYAMMVAEIFYGSRCPQRLPWPDPPAHQLEF
ncbi:hypothetical protein PMZ80_002492 [Knufia obscura]|uniref:Lysine-specific metallo-endopeptidase domain-containing protein n=2 Tax=Knufia TaxID=430999 RepID=A0AAN8ECC3_9EURO|nr:hypothetical protein PMZ80_002492 [Knufia obscura]KAK5950800.1 hypothetical protein OHC33_008183 [Knufia fluminis]